MNFSLINSLKQNKHKAVLLTLLICFLPTFANWFGIDFSSLTSVIDNIHGQVSIGKVHHTITEWTGVCVAFVGALIAFNFYCHNKDFGVALIALIFIAAGIADGFHVLAASNVLNVKADDPNFIPFTWAYSRVILSVLVVCLSFSILRLNKTGDKLLSPTKLLALVAVLIIVMAATITFILSWPELPITTFQSSLITRPYDVVPLALFILALILVTGFRKGTLHKLYFWFGISLLLQIASQIHMSFGSTALFDNHFNIAHGLKVLAYLWMLFGVISGADISLSNQANSPDLKSNSIPVKQQYANKLLAIGLPKMPLSIIMPGCAFLLSIVITLFIGSTYYLDTKKMLVEQEIEQLQIESRLVSPALSNYFQKPYDDLLFLEGSPPIQPMIDAIKNGDVGLANTLKNRLNMIFTGLVQQKSEYLRISFVNKEKLGKEIFAVTRRDNAIHRVPESKLSYFANEDYFTKSLEKLPGEVYFSRIRLDRHQGVVIEPRLAVLDVATPVYDDVTGEVFGALIIETNFDLFVKQLKSNKLIGRNYYLANLEGDFLLHPEQQSKTFGFDLDQRHQMQFEFPELAGAIEQDLDSFVVNTMRTEEDKDDYRLIGTYSKVNLEGGIAQRPLRLFLMFNQELLNEQLTSFRNHAFLLGFVLAVIALAIAVMASRRIIAPLLETTEAIEHFDRYGELIKLPVNSNDEIGVLARSFHNLLVIKQEQDKELLEQKFALDQHTLVTITDLDYNITFVNDLFCRVTGFAREELLNTDLKLLRSAHHDQDFYQLIEETTAAGNVWRGDVCNKTQAGEVIWLDTSIIPFKDDAGQPVSFITIRTDITQQKNAETELINAKQIAESATETKSEFLASMSHEIRTPMNGVIGMLELLANTKLSDEQGYRLSLAKSSAESLLTIINDILDFSKVEAGKLEFEYINFDLRQLLGDFAESLAMRAQGKGLELILDITKIMPAMVKGDPTRIRQILNNLAGNAIKFTETGEIIIRARLDRNEQKQLVLHCSVIDTGIGIADNKINLLFDKFTQADTSTTRQYGGTGLGLSIARQLCLLMGGDIEVSSVMGKGSTFEFHILLNDSEEQRPMVPELEIDNLAVLVVVENDTSRKALTEQLQSWGATVVGVKSAELAIRAGEQRIQEQQEMFDIAFIDKALSNIDGLQLAKAFKASDNFATMKLILMTPLAEQIKDDFYQTAGISACFTKPVTTSDLFDSISATAFDKLSINTQMLINEIKVHNNEGVVAKTVNTSDARILIVDDNKINQLVALGVLQDLGYCADLADSGPMAIELIQAAQDEDSPYQLVFMDCQMPEMDGYEATQALRHLQAEQKLMPFTIVAMTANAMRGDKQKCLDAGMDDYLSKPINPEKLEKVLNHWLQNSSKNSEIDEKPVLDVVNESLEYEASSSFDMPAALKVVSGKKDLLNTLLNLFTADFDCKFAQITKSIEAQDGNNLRLVAHTLRGEAENLKLTRIAKEAAILEKSAIEQKFSELDKCMENLQGCYREALPLIEQFVQINTPDKTEVDSNQYSRMSEQEQQQVYDFIAALTAKLMNSEYVSPDDFVTFNGLCKGASFSASWSELQAAIAIFDNQRALELAGKITEELAKESCCEQ